MKLKYLSILLICFGISHYLPAQKIDVTIEDFITEHEGLDHQNGEIVPININEIKRKIRFFIEEKYPDVVQVTDNIIWDSYQTYTSHSNKYHYHTFIVRAIVKNTDRIKFVEVLYNPFNELVYGYFRWDNEQQTFYLEEEAARKELKKPDLISLGIANQAVTPGLNDIVSEHEGFLQMIQLKNQGRNGLVPLDVETINEKIKTHVGQKYNNVEYTRNIIWNSYSTFMSPYSKHHFHSFIAQVKVKGVRIIKYLELFYNPVTEKVTSDFVWVEDEEEFLRIKPTEED